MCFFHNPNFAAATHRPHMQHIHTNKDIPDYLPYQLSSWMEHSQAASKSYLKENLGLLICLISMEC